MQKELTLRLPPSGANSSDVIKHCIAYSSGNKIEAISGFHVLKKSLDARSKQPWINLHVKAFINEPFIEREIEKIELLNVSQARKKVIVVGAGPAGLFAALKLMEHGIKPIILERGKDVRARRRDLALLNKEGIVNPESNYCFGEGGAGTYSDGKLYTRSNKRGDINRILNIFVQFGAQEQILYDAHPHIGTNKLPQIITAMRQAITDCGGEYHFEKKVVGFVLKQSAVTGVKTADGQLFEGDAVILATGHSARDIFTLLHSQNILIEAKPFALGVRVEHPQSVIDNIQYHIQSNIDLPKESVERPHDLPPASYSLVQQVGGNGVFSFCMCPGGIIAPASTNPGELVVNGWSPSKRNNPFANSGMVVTCNKENVADITAFKDFLKAKQANIDSPLAMLYFQQMVEHNAFVAGGGKLVAPAQRMVDFSSNKISSSMPDCSYLPGVSSTDLRTAIPKFVYESLQNAFKLFGNKMKGYFTNDALVVATESRTSSPVRIPRDYETLQHPQISNLYPCGEGAGYAGGIVSAAMDGERVAAMIVLQVK